MLPAIEGKVSQNVHKKSYDDIVLEAYEREAVGSRMHAHPTIVFAWYPVS
jgi:hypothetical protein